MRQNNNRLFLEFLRGVEIAKLGQFFSFKLNLNQKRIYG